MTILSPCPAKARSRGRYEGVVLGYWKHRKWFWQAGFSARTCIAHLPRSNPYWSELSRFEAFGPSCFSMFFRLFNVLRCCHCFQNIQPDSHGNSAQSRFYSSQIGQAVPEILRIVSSFQLSLIAINSIPCLEKPDPKPHRCDPDL